MRDFRTAIATIAIAAAIYGVPGAQATPSNPDLTFGENGRTWVSPTVPGIALAPYLTLRADGASLVLERDHLSLVDPRGVVDPSFGYGEAGPLNGCPVATPCPLFRLERPVFGPNGQIFVPFATDNETPPRVGIVRLDANGKRDLTFGSGGSAARADADALQVDPPVGVNVEADGSVVAVYVMTATTGFRSVYLARWRPDGSPDLSFGDRGRRITQLADDRHGIAVAFQPDGRIVVGQLSLARVENQRDVYRTTVARLLPDGAPDYSFNTFRQEGTDLFIVTSLVLARDGSIVVTGGTRVSAGALEAFRLRPDGTRDMAFGNAGLARVPAHAGCAIYVTAGAAIDSAGRIVLLAPQECPVGTSTRVAATVARLLPSGPPDDSFAANGFTTVFEAFGLLPRQVAVDAQDRIVFAGIVQATEAHGGHTGIYDTRAAVYRLQGGDGAGPAGAAQQTAVEFFHAAFGHYFVTAHPIEAAQLDIGSDWKRTGRAFRVWSEPEVGSLPVCRFWSGQSFAPKSSHFLTPYPGECATLRTGNVWTYEGDVFFLRLPEGVPNSRTCPPGTIPLYRAHNNGLSGAPNHRYTTDAALLDQMIAQGWIMEGEAQTRVFACAPAQ